MDNLLNQLENTYAYLTEDIKALEDLQELYFISTKPIKDEDTYFKIQNYLATIIKSMKLTELNLKEQIALYYD